MGTLWSPNNTNSQGQSGLPGASSGSLPSQSQQTSARNASVSNNNTNSFPSKVASSGSVNNSMSSSNNTLNSQRKYPSTSMRPIVVQNNVSGKKNTNSKIDDGEFRARLLLHSNTAPYCNLSRLFHYSISCRWQYLFTFTCWTGILDLSYFEFGTVHCEF